MIQNIENIEVKKVWIKVKSGLVFAVDSQGEANIYLRDGAVLASESEIPAEAEETTQTTKVVEDLVQVRPIRTELDNVDLNTFNKAQLLEKLKALDPNTLLDDKTSKDTLIAEIEKQRLAPFGEIIGEVEVK